MKYLHVDMGRALEHSKKVRNVHNATVCFVKEIAYKEGLNITSPVTILCYSVVALHNFTDLILQASPTDSDCNMTMRALNSCRK